MFFFNYLLHITRYWIILFLTDKSVHDIGSTKITNHVVPTHRRSVSWLNERNFVCYFPTNKGKHTVALYLSRARTRGALLQDNEDDDGRWKNKTLSKCRVLVFETCLRCGVGKQNNRYDCAMQIFLCCIW